MRSVTAHTRKGPRREKQAPGQSREARYSGSAIGRPTIQQIVGRTGEGAGSDRPATRTSLGAADQGRPPERAAKGGSVSRRPAPSEHPDDTTGVMGDRVLTLPNLISFVRLVGVPLFLYLFLVARADVAAVVVLAIGGTSDWVDGWVARRMRQVSRLGELLDPLADRLYILATLLAFTARDVVPWQFTAALLARELLLLGSLGVLRRHGYGPPPVHYVGKTATFLLLAAFPILLLAAAAPDAATVAGAVGWGLAWWGLVLYWAAGAMYVVQASRLVRAMRDRRAGAVV